jgi:hypothetical protein
MINFNRQCLHNTCSDGHHDATSLIIDVHDDTFNSMHCCKQCFSVPHCWRRYVISSWRMVFKTETGKFWHYDIYVPGGLRRIFFEITSKFLNEIWFQICCQEFGWYDDQHKNRCILYRPIYSLFCRARLDHSKGGWNSLDLLQYARHREIAHCMHRDWESEWDERETE